MLQQDQVRHLESLLRRSTLELRVARRCRALLLAVDGLSNTEIGITADPLETKDLAAGKPEVVKHIVAKIEAWKATLPEKPTGDVFSQERQK